MRPLVHVLLAAAATLWCALLAPSVRAAVLPSGFTEVLVASGFVRPTAMQFAPDGRLFVCEQAGRVRVVKDGTLLPTPFVTLDVSDLGERGVLGVAFDPGFATNGYVYVFHTARTPTVQNRISRFTAAGDVAAPGSEVVILELGPAGSSTNHNGGALAFGPDGMLYVAVGDHGDGANSQSLHNLFGKILRIRPDGSAPPDNPFYSATTGKNRAIWAIGLRNPFTFAFHPDGHSLFINDVGGSQWEEIDAGAPGANYGFPHTEGPHPDPRFVNPIAAYRHENGACAIVGGAFYAPATMQFPSDHRDDYFFADFCAGWIKKRDAVDGTVSTFATGISFPVDLKVAGDGSLYYLAGINLTDGAIFRIQHGAPAPGITAHPESRVVPPGAAATFSVRASGTPPLSYQWQKNGVNIPGATAPDYTTPSVSWSDDGSRYRAVVSNAAGSVPSREALLTVSNNRPPVATILQPAQGSLYTAGGPVTVVAAASDAEDGTLPPSAYTWRVDFHHDTHAHPFLPMTSGISRGTFTIPTTGEPSSNVWYRIYLRVRDSGGLTHTVFRDIHPRKVRLTLNTSPAGLPLRLDEQVVTTPLTFESVIGTVRTIEAPSARSSGYDFAGWSHGGPARHVISTPSADATYVARYEVACAAPPPAPSGYSVQVSGHTVNLSWSPAPGATSYILEAGSSPGSTNLYRANVGTATSLRGAVPPGAYFTRIRSVNGCGASGPSNEVHVVVGCTTIPAAPGNLQFAKAGSLLTLTWAASSAATSYRLVVGTAPSAGNLFDGDIGARTALPVDVSAVRAGTYFVRVFARNTCGVSSPSNEIAVRIP